MRALFLLREEKERERKYTCIDANQTDLMRLCFASQVNKKC